MNYNSAFEPDSVFSATINPSAVVRTMVNTNVFIRIFDLFFLVAREGRLLFREGDVITYADGDYVSGGNGFFEI